MSIVKLVKQFKYKIAKYKIYGLILNELFRHGPNNKYMHPNLTFDIMMQISQKYNF